MVMRASAVALRKQQNRMGEVQGGVARVTRGVKQPLSMEQPSRMRLRQDGQELAARHVARGL